MIQDPSKAINIILLHVCVTALTGCLKLTFTKYILISVTIISNKQNKWLSSCGNKRRYFLSFKIILNYVMQLIFRSFYLGKHDLITIVLISIGANIIFSSLFCFLSFVCFISCYWVLSQVSLSNAICGMCNLSSKFQMSFQFSSDLLSFCIKAIV